ncbi:hypothetical protein MKW92_031066 [Papaver armeniacum]|nr:hypothetical protein MKW92_031066 [Papaver armeniacum]
MHKLQKEVIRKRLQCAPGKISLTSDMWTSVNTTGYISLTVHFVDQDWVLQKFLLNFSPLPPPHTFVFTHLRLVDPDYAESPNGEEWEQIKVVTKFLKFIRNMAKKMQEKFAKYWKKLSPILAMAVVLDPRLKFEFVEFTFRKVYPTEREMKKEVDIIKKRMAALYEEYHTASTLRGFTSNETRIWEFAAAKKNGGSISKDFDILKYWRSQELRYPNITRMAIDILAIPISTCCFESAFSLGGRVLDGYHSLLITRKCLDALITTRDWIYGIGAASTDVEEVKDNDISEDVLAFEPANNNEAVSSYASN